MKYILTLLTLAFTLSACSTTTHSVKSTCPHSKGGDECCATPAKKK
jgi:starvation-inducible outer membrane lipoprotein